MNKSRERFEEYLAAGMLKDIGFIGDDFTIADRPDIIFEDIGVEVTTKASTKWGSKLLFGDAKGIEITNILDFNCCSCPKFESCKSAFNINDTPRCSEYQINGLANINGVIYENPALFYIGKNHPIPISNSEPLIDLNCEQDIQNIIFDKEIKSKNYKKLRELNLFIFYDRDTIPTLNIESKIFKNIFVYSIPTGELYKNFKLIKEYPGGISENAFLKLTTQKN